RGQAEHRILDFAAQLAARADRFEVESFEMAQGLSSRTMRVKSTGQDGRCWFSSRLPGTICAVPVARTWASQLIRRFQPLPADPKDLGAGTQFIFAAMDK